jgi:hypothetical protein
VLDPQSSIASTQAQNALIRPVKKPMSIPPTIAPGVMVPKFTTMPPISPTAMIRSPPSSVVTIGKPFRHQLIRIELIDIWPLLFTLPQLSCQLG